LLSPPRTQRDPRADWCRLGATRLRHLAGRRALNRALHRVRTDDQIAAPKASTRPAFRERRIVTDKTHPPDRRFGDASSISGRGLAALGRHELRLAKGRESAVGGNQDG
jgi:hypothetical protein